MKAGVILYGPPAAGKDTVTGALNNLDPRFSLYHRLKCGSGRTETYRMITRAVLTKLHDANEIIWENQQYGSLYAVDRTGLAAHLNDGVPVLHLGQVAAVDAVQLATPDTLWFVVGLWCSRDTASKRLEGRGSKDTSRRLAVWDATPPLGPPATTLNTDLISAEDAADLIAATIKRSVTNDAYQSRLGTSPR
jgi:guanylate kinase